MLDLPGHPTLDKLGLIGACSRLPVRVDAERLQAEVAALPESSWAGTGGRVGVHRAAQAIFLRGFAPAEGEKPIEDREPLGALPYVRELITKLIPAPAQRCLLARLPAAARITGHIDLAPYFAKTIRIHVPVVTNADAWMYCAGLSFRMQPGRSMGAEQLGDPWRMECARDRGTHPPDLRLSAEPRVARAAGARRT